MTLFHNLRERKVGAWTVGYVALAWGALQIIDFMATHFGWPDSIVRAITVFLAVNILSVIILAWYHGTQGPQRTRPTELLLLALVLAAAGIGAWTAARHVPAAVARSGRATADNPVDSTAISATSIAVIPFVNHGPADQEYFSDGITEEILDAIAKVPGFQVAARTSSFAFKGKDMLAPELARQLHVAHLVMGSVQRSGDRVRVTSQLYSAATNANVWSNRYDGDAKDLFAMEDSIGKSIAQQLQQTIGADVVLASNATSNVDAHVLYLQGLDRWSVRNTPAIHDAMDFFTRAIKADSMYAKAHAGLALALSVLPNYDRSVDPAPIFARGRAEALKALAIDGNTEDAYAALSQIAQYSDDAATAERFARKAIAIKWSYATAHQWLGESFWFRGRLDEALAQLDTAVMLDPLSPVILATRGSIRQARGDIKGARADNDAALAIDPTFNQAVSGAMQIALVMKDYGLARKHLRTLLAPSHSEFIADTVVNGLRNPAQRAALLRLIDRSTTGEHEDLMFIAELAGSRELALRHASQADKAGEPYWRFWPLLSMPAMKALRDDPRFPARLRWPRK